MARRKFATEHNKLSERRVPASVTVTVDCGMSGLSQHF